jgi:hypothetical protein
MSEMAEILVAPLFIESGGFTSRVIMVNELNFAVNAQVSLFDRNGTKIGSQTVAFAAHSRQDLAVSDLLAQAHSTETVGSVEILPDPATVTTMAIAAQISITGSGGSIGQHIEEEFLMVGTQGSGVLRSAGGSLSGQPVLAIKNTGAAAQTATISCIAEKGGVTQQQVQLAAGGSALVRACTNSVSSAVGLLPSILATAALAAVQPVAFGISVAGSGQPGSLAVFGFSWRSTSRGGMISSQNFVDAGLAQSGNTVFTGVPVGSSNYLPGAVFAPEVAVTNFGTKAVNATVLFARTDASGVTTTPVATASIPAMSSQTVALPALTGDPGLRNSFIVQSDATPGTFYSSVVAVGSSGFDLVEQIGKDEQIGDNGGGHPWDLTGGQDAVLLLFNHSAVAKYFNVNIGNGGVLWQQSWQLAPMESRTISVRDLIASQTKDRNGMVLPASLEHGEISWFTPNPSEGKGRLLQIDPSSQLVAGNKRIARNFSCGYNFVLCGAYLQTNAITFGYETASSPYYLGQVVPMICTAFNPTACTGQSYSQGGSGYSYNWQSNNTSIATVYGSTTSSTATFYGQGVGTGSATGFVMSGYCNSGGGGTPSVAKLVCSPTSMTRGGSVSCSVTGAPANTTISWSFSGGGGSVTGPSGTTTTWSGTMVQGGTVTATVSGQALMQNISVNPRGNFTVGMPAATQVTNGTTPLPVLVSPPTTAEGSFGQSMYVYSFNLGTSEILSGPNSGFDYVTALNTSASYPYELNPGITNPNDPFYQHQYGKCGVPTAQVIAGLVTAHEAGSQNSHWAEVAAQLAKQNPGPVAEGSIGLPGTPPQALADKLDPPNGPLDSLFKNAANAGNVEPPVNLPAGINYPPYTSCP